MCGWSVPHEQPHHEKIFELLCWVRRAIVQRLIKQPELELWALNLSTHIHKRGSLHTWLCLVRLHPLHPTACFTSARAETENSERCAKPVCHNSAEVLFADSQPGCLHFRNAFKRSYLQPRRAKRGRLALATLKGLCDEMKWKALFDVCSINCEVMSAQACDKCWWIALTGATWCCEVPQGAAGFAEKTDTEDFT